MNKVQKLLMIVGVTYVLGAQLGHAQVLPQVQRLPQTVPPLIEPLERVDELAQRQIRPTVFTPEIAELSSLEQVTEHLTEVLPTTLEIVNQQGTSLVREVTVENGWRALEREWLVVIDADDIEQLEQLPLTLIARQTLSNLALTVVRFSVSEALDSRAALQQMLPADMHQTLARQHIFFAQQGSAEQSSVQPALTSSEVCDSHLKIGVIDTRIDHAQGYFRHAKLQQKSFLDPQLQQPLAHGTAVAGLWVAQGEGLQPLVPNAEIYAAEVFYQQNELSQGAPVSALVEALDWLVSQGTPVINMSIAGPDNAILKIALQRVHEQGTYVVAAAGNAGPAAPALYPAGYEEVIAVTAVDAERVIYRWANRGAHIDYAALGVNVATVRAGGGLSAESGTSIAAPVVTALLSCELQRTPAEGAVSVASYLAPYLEDLGEPGPDKTFGHGLLRPTRND